MNGAQRAAALTQRLLAFARRQPLDPKPLDANVLVRGMSELLRRSLGETVEVEIVLGGGLWRTEADPNELESALLNLAVNARDAMPSGGKLTIETSNGYLDEAWCFLTAEDENCQESPVSMAPVFSSTNSTNPAGPPRAPSRDRFDDLAPRPGSDESARREQSPELRALSQWVL
jgi:C4-dicarboxylate-specific signal transduction histidine kinase